MLTGDRRLAPSRKLTVLGKVPKPINLPSQRSENHGLDPNVEIVPKGTLTWGSRSSLTVSNAWGTSVTLSPRTDGSAGSPSHCPSSGGGTRPSTAGSDKSHEPVSNAWGPNSRPSSASGILASSQISAATRPRSAETRPRSSQLSRFADNSADSTAAWGATGSAERLGTVLSKNSVFTLSFGDFPSLGSDKNSDTHSQRGHSSQGRPLSSQGRPANSQGHPASASGPDPKPVEILEPQLAELKNRDYLDHGTVINTWKADNPAYAGHGASPNMENWHSDPHLAPQYPNMNMPHRPYDSWHNPSFRPAEGSWYRSRAAGGPCRPPGPPSSYPIDYSHISGPGGFYPNNCGQFHPYMPPERYMGPGHSNIQVRPGPYVEPVSYGPRPNFYNSAERETSIMGMARPVHNQYLVQHDNIHTTLGGCATVGNRDQMKPNQAHETQGKFRVLLKSGDYDEQEKREHFATTDLPDYGSGNHPESSSQESNGETKSQMQETVSPSYAVAIVTSQTSGVTDGRSKDDVRNLVADSSNVADGTTVRTGAANIHSRDLQQHPLTKKNATLMEKVESLNNKARIFYSHSEGGSISREKVTSSKNLSIVDPSAKDPAASLNMETPSIKPEELNASTKDNHKQSTKDRIVLPAALNSVGAGDDPHFMVEKKDQTARSADSHTKFRSYRHDNKEWMKKSPGSESSVNISRISVKDGTLEVIASTKVPEKQELCLEAGAVDGSHAASSLDPVDHEAQRAKRKELAMERAKQLQREEEERIREQKAKALAKLEELNRRTLAESSSLKSKHGPSKSSDILNNNQETGLGDRTSIEALSGTSDCHSEAMKQADDGQLSSDVAEQASNPFFQSSVMMEAQPLSLGQEISATTKIDSATTKIALETTSDISHNKISRQKQMGYRKRNNILHESSTDEKQTISASTGSPIDSVEIEVNASSKDSLPKNEDPPVQHKKKNNTSARNNNSNNLDEGLMSSSVSFPLHVEGSSDKLKDESGKNKPSTTVAEAISLPSESNETVETLNVPENQGLSEKTEETQGKVGNRWKHHAHRKNQQANKPISKYQPTKAVMWAPVKPTSKSEKDQVSQNYVQNRPKTKRAEIERYVPKPVAKELSHPEQQTTAASAIINGEKYKSNKHGRTNSSWRQQSSTGYPQVEGSLSSDQLQTLNVDNLPKEQLTHTDDGWNDNDNLMPIESVTSTVVSKNYVASRQRRQQYKVQRTSGSIYPDSDNMASRALGDNESEGRSIMKSDSQNAGIENIKPHWQPKSQRGNRGQWGPTMMNEEDRTSSKRNPVAEEREARYPESRREHNTCDLAPQNVGYQHGHYNGHYQRGHDANYGGRNLAQDSSKQKFQTHGDKHIRSYDKPMGSFQQNPSDGNVASEVSRTSGPRYRRG